MDTLETWARLITLPKLESHVPEYSRGDGQAYERSDIVWDAYSAYIFLSLVGRSVLGELLPFSQMIMTRLSA